MPYFEYRGRDASGALVTGTLDAGSADEAASRLFGDSVTPIDITQTVRGNADTTTKKKAVDSRARAKERELAKEKKAKSKATTQPPSTRDNLVGLFTKKRVEEDDLIMFARQMHSLTKSGLPLDRSIKGLERSLSNPYFRQILRHVIDSLENGQPLATALGNYPKVFSQLFLSLVHVGENTGRLDLAFKEVSRYLELEKSTRKQVKGATRYPSFVLLAMIAAVGVVTVFVIPVFSSTFDRLGADLPWQTVVLINSSDFVINYWPYLLAAVGAYLFSFMSWIGTDSGRTKWDERKMNMPLAGKVFKKVALARFARSLSMVLAAGLPVVQGLTVVSGAVGNSYVAKKVNKMRAGVERGESLHRTAVKSRMFTPLVLQMIAVGEETGTVDELLNEVAEFYDAEVEYEIKSMSDAIEPIMISFIAGLVLILALGVFLPIWDLNTAIQ